MSFYRVVLSWTILSHAPRDSQSAPSAGALSVQSLHLPRDAYQASTIFPNTWSCSIAAWAAPASVIG